MPKCELVIFDSDGTLMDTETIAAEVEAEVLEEYGAKITAKEFAERFAGTSSQHVQKIMEEELGRHFPESHHTTVMNKMKERFWREAKAISGAHEMLDMLDQPRCICSNSEPEKLKVSLTRGELWDRFRPYIYSAYELESGRKKPAPDIFLHAAAEFEVQPEACIVVEDSVAGVSGARAAGMRVIGFTGGSHTYLRHADDLTEAGAETVIKRLTDIPALIEVFAGWSGFEG